ncbi:hypothetical protein FACS189468_5680 [Spirochaetia bacterium]|nr:hypothetical protein FACS189468_5680 [Spirochaetia bacterium]
MSVHWLPSSRVERLALAQQWAGVLADKASDWSVPAAQVTALNGLITPAAETLAKVQDRSSRSHVDSVACQTAFKALTEHMRFLKNNYFNSPPRTAQELAMLGLAGHNPPGDIPPPENQVTGKTRPLGDHLLELRMEIVGDMIRDQKASDYGKRVYVAIEDSVNAGTSSKYGKYLAAPPQSGEDFSWSFFTRRWGEIFDFNEQDRGKKVWFIAHLENAKGDKGPWGPLLWTIIP